MNLGLDGKVVFITGASGGIGRAVADVLAGEGARVVLQGHTQFERMRAWTAQQDWADQALCVQADVTEPDELEAAFESAEAHFGGLHGCVVNAGIWPTEDTPLVDMEPDRLRRTLDVNLAGAMWTSRAFLRSVRRSMAGAPDHAAAAGAALVLTGSTAGRFGEAGHSDYAASKAGLYGLVRSLKNEIVAIDPRGRVNVVDPGWVATEMAEETLNVPGAVERATRTSPLRRVAAPEDIAGSIAWLLSPLVARHVTGEMVTVSGGMEGRVLWE